ncbi:hypothetical protein Ddye_025295 [Dipteronia dyeriana]|uniref:Uncharacterized protein n=1 Tax=Dipteronia dyeriana TaxID=168575 RepID=A0AAD9WV22_9ROSI|nr:hypothetical protein Ddye_025295 [Dipteronia dyeriana]
MVALLVQTHPVVDSLECQTILAVFLFTVAANHCKFSSPFGVIGNVQPSADFFDPLVTMSSDEENSVSRRRLSCFKCFDALWFCYSPVHQLQQYYRLGVFDNCTDKWSALVDCLTLKTKSSSKVEA